MGFADLFFAQIIDPFRIGLLIALVVTTLNTSKATGFLIPLALGTAFVAVLIPMTMGADSDDPKTNAILIGVVTNAVIVGIVMAARALWLRLNQPKDG